MLGKAIIKLDQTLFILINVIAVRDTLDSSLITSKCFARHIT